MGLFSSIAGAVAGPLVGGLFGGDDGGGGGRNYNVPNLSQFNMENLDQYQLDQFKGTAGLTNFNNQMGDLDLSNFDYNSNLSEYGSDLPDLNEFDNTMGDLSLDQYTGPTTVETGNIYDQMESNVMNQLQGQGLGMSEQEMQTYLDQINSNLSESRDEGVNRRLAEMNNRGVLTSSMTGDAMSDVNENYLDSYSDAQVNMFLQNESLKRNQYNNAMSQGMGLSQYSTGLQQQNIGNLMNALNMNNQYAQTQYNTNYQNRFNENQYNNQLSQQDYNNLFNQQQANNQLRQQDFQNEFNTWQANTNVDKSEYNTNYGNQFNEWQANNQVNQNRFSNEFNTWQANNNVLQQNLANELDVLGFNNNVMGQEYNMQLGERAYENQQNMQRSNSIGAGFQMGSTIGEGTSLGSGWGGAIGALLGGMFG